MSYPNFYFGTVSKNIIDAVIETANSNELEIGLISSRAQVDFNAGYCGFKTSELHKYVRKRTEYVYLERDHGGLANYDDESNSKKSFKIDSNCMDIIHIDPFKYLTDFNSCIDYTIQMIKYIYKNNKNIKYEIGTEQAVYKYSPYQFRFMLQELERKLTTDQFNNILFAVIQSGNKMDLLTGTNSSEFEDDRFLDFVDICYEFKIFAKEHNCDFLPNISLLERFDLGLYAVNIAPELGRYESQFIWNYMLDNQTYKEMGQFYDLVVNKSPYRKWTNVDLDTVAKEDICIAFGHYVFDTSEFKLIKDHINLADDIIRGHLILKIDQYLDLLYGTSEDIEIGGGDDEV